MTLKIEYLKLYENHLPKLAEWMFNEWGKYNPSSSLEKTKSKLQEHLNLDKLPITWIALLNDKPVGTCSLRVNDGIRTDLAPWLGSLYVDPAARGQQIGENLIEVTKTKARMLGYKKLYLLAYDLTIPDWYSSLGWEHVGKDMLNGHDVNVMSINL